MIPAGSIGYAAGLAVWGGALFGILQVHLIPGNWGHAVCGPWGCGPPMQALVAYHGFWLMLLFPPALTFSNRTSTERLVDVGRWVALFGSVCLLCYMGWEAIDWLARASERHRLYVVQRCLFVVITLVDVPIVQVTMLGLTMYGIGRRRARFELNSRDDVPERVTERSADPFAPVETAGRDPEPLATQSIARR